MASERHTDDTPRGRVRIRFAPSGRDVHVPAGVAVFDAASWNGIAIDSTCGGHGTCKKCKVRVIGTAALPTSLDFRAFNADELAAGWRLACRTQAMFDVDIEVPPLTTRPKAATVGVGRQVILRPAVQKRYVELSEPSLSDQTPDIERLLRELDDLELRVDLQALRSIGRALRSNDSKVTAVVVDDVLIDVEPGDTTAAMYGLAFDLGTTTVVATLLDLSTGTPAAAALGTQSPTAVRRRCHHPDQRGHDRNRRARKTPIARARDPCRAGGRGLRRGGRRPEERLRSRPRWQRDDDPHHLGRRSRAARRGTVHPLDACISRDPRVGLGCAGTPTGAGGRVPFPRRLRRW